MSDKTPVVEITEFPFLDAHCHAPDGCPVCQSKRCQFGRIGDMLVPPQPQCQKAATAEWPGGLRWCAEHDFKQKERLRTMLAEVPGE